jgi:undecaprenyl-phosphate 4-deoxy-4-formamido-L-arabinose transferase
MKNQIKVSIVVPCYQSEHYLEGTIVALYLELLALSSSHIEFFEIILVIDGSPDQTGRIADALERRFQQVRVLHLPVNSGQHAATLEGVRISRMPWVLTMDDDGQHPPTEILKLINGIDMGIDVIYGISTVGEHGLFRNFFSRLVKFLLFWILEDKAVTTFSAFRLFRRSILGEINSDEFARKIIDVELYRVTSNFKQVAVTMKKRESGVSNYTVMTLARLAVRMGIGYSRKR